MFAQIAVPLPLPPLTYAVPDGMQPKVGDAVLVRVRKKILSGTVLALDNKAPESHKFEIKPLEGFSEDFPQLHSETLQTLRWISDYYLCPIGEVLRTFLPPKSEPPKKEVFFLTPEGKNVLLDSIKGEKQREIILLGQNGNEFSLDSELRPSAKTLIKKGWLESKFILSEEIAPETSPGTPPELNPDQLSALESIRESITHQNFEPFLLQGITGSGKTEVYLHAAQAALDAGRSVLVVVPEIALTPQLVGRFKSRLTQPIAVLHSGLSDGERSRQWHLLNQGKYRVCVGARSAALAPIKNLGLIVVDEEHDGALKQEDHLRYHARDLCIVRAKSAKCPVILGSATPSLESFHNARSGKYKHLILPNRAAGNSLPEVKVVDQTKYSAENLLSPPLKVAMQKTLAAGQQIMLLLNRRGFSSFLLCGDCGHVPGCPNCSVSLTNYKSGRQLKCHYCGYTSKIHVACEKCHSEKILTGTEGTESLEEEVRRDFPQHPCIRIDRESMERKGSLEAALEAIANKSADIIIGTQMIAKGHDFPNISLVGVINADTAFHLPDFRASERSFQLFTQMGGRAGRGEIPGLVFIQTFNPNHPSIVYSTNHDYRGFAEEELLARHAFLYPPYSRMARILVSANSEALVAQQAEKIGALLNKIATKTKVEVIGPSPAVLFKIQNRYRWNILLKSTGAAPLHSTLQTLQSHLHNLKDSKVVVQVDVDPNSLM